ncbi:MAG: addiction module protein [Rudaea sp.]|uniref:addiction module protein n=1 Tax=Rudaea sp. TaxID=2136325 RepID=UPI0039E2294E
MSTALDILQAQALSLSKEDRSHLLERLIPSLDVDVEGEEQWEQVAAQRDAELNSSVAAAIPLEDAMARLRARFHG